MREELKALLDSIPSLIETKGLVVTIGLNDRDAICEAMKNARASLAAEGEGALQPMSTAPKDGREVLLQVKSRAGMAGCFLVGHWMQGGHCIDDHPPIAAGWYGWTGTMFMPRESPVAWARLPEPVKVTERVEEGGA